MPNSKTAKFKAAAIIATMRSGSNLLERILIQNPQIVGAGELFNDKFIGRVSCENYDGISIEERNAHPDVLLTYINKKFAPKMPIFRYFHDHQDSAFNAIVEDKDIAKILLLRNPLDSFLSLKMAQQSDSWLIGRRKKQRERTKIDFKPHIFEQWVEDTDAFYTNTRAKLQATQQDLFEIRYENVKNLDALNDLAEFLGLEQGFDYFFEPTMQQNPQKREEMVNNPEDLTPFSPLFQDHPQQQIRKTKPVIDRLFLAENVNLAYMPIEGTAINEEKTALEKANDAPLQEISASELIEKQEQSPEISVYTRVVDPIDRVFTLLFEHIYQEKNAFDVPFDQIMQDLNAFTTGQVEEKSRQALNAVGLPPRRIRRLYGNFVVYLRKELWGGLRNHLISDQYWPQALLIENMQNFFTIHVLKDQHSPQSGIFAPLSEHGPIRSTYLDAPLSAEQLVQGNFTKQILDLYREDYEVFKFEIEEDDQAATED